MADPCLKEPVKFRPQSHLPLVAALEGIGHDASEVALELFGSRRDACQPVDFDLENTL